MKQECVYNPKIDISSVQQDGYIDLVEAFENRVIPADVSGADLTFEDCENTDALLPKAEDVFQQHQQLHTIRSLKTSPENDSSDQS